MSQRAVVILSAGLFILTVGLSLILFKNSDGKNHQGHTHTEKVISGDTIYTCSMHPEIRQEKPGNCPICGMKLVKISDDSSTKMKANAKGKASFNVSPYQASLVGIKPIPALIKSVTYAIPVSGRLVSRSTLALQVFERDLRYIKPGVKFEGRSEVFPEDLIQGEIASVDNMADPGSRTIRVIGRIKNGGRNSLSESSFTGQIIIELGKKLVVPEKSILFTGNGSVVYLYKEESLYPQKVSLGPKVEEEYVILEGLAEGDLISSGPNFLIDSESKLRGLSGPDKAPECPDGEQWNAPMAMCMPGKKL